ncbi:MAG: hypothetical protein LCH99_24960 [Proteobacteria bacterium]|jgi:hypothetical protein|nr:hypothetical protein [Pseudomonadota bacterium]
MDTTFGTKDDTAGLKLKIKVSKQGPDPEGLTRWDVFEKRYFIMHVLIGSVLAGSREDALAKAKAQWPNVKRISVDPSLE